MASSSVSPVDTVTLLCVIRAGSHPHAIHNTRMCPRHLHRADRVERAEKGRPNRRKTPQASQGRGPEALGVHSLPVGPRESKKTSLPSCPGRASAENPPCEEIRRPPWLSAFPEAMPSELLALHPQFPATGEDEGSGHTPQPAVPEILKESEPGGLFVPLLCVAVSSEEVPA